MIFQCFRYFTGLSPLLLSSQCRYTDTTYTPTRPGFLLGDRREEGFTGFIQGEVNRACSQLNLTVNLRPVKSLYGAYKWNDLASHRGIVALPLQPSMMALFEIYDMNIPLFLPSKVGSHNLLWPVISFKYEFYYAHGLCHCQMTNRYIGGLLIGIIIVFDFRHVTFKFYLKCHHLLHICSDNWNRNLVNVN